MFVKLPSGRGEHDQMENRERSTVNLRSLLADKKADRRQTAEAVPESRSRSGVVGQGSLDHHVGRGGKFPILTNGSGISIAPMIDRSVRRLCSRRMFRRTGRLRVNFTSTQTVQRQGRRCGSATMQL
ncbi:hypothetical protein T12_5430 [Trichinella patagoniensis]|uniref:Uncharacterized protein n=1 Tax=Trichinella patagoniensis TaxID=990121 RepID=A0A0V1A455_9BILA|nr:hypothetical protein T12_5430 [Trichinella patagoniensis]